MPSPFPGMDPWLEGRLWPDVHGSLIYTIRAALVAALPDGYAALIDQYVWLQSDEPNGPERFGVPDVFVAGGDAPTGGGRAAVSVAEPTVRVALAAGRRTKTRRFLRILDAVDRSVVTVLELLSPANKTPGDDRQQYLSKRNEYLAADVNLVEIDLLRDGERLPLGRPRPPQADYYILVSRAGRRQDSAVWAFTVRDPIPVVPVPLKPDDGTVALDIRGCLDRVYDEARHDRNIDYDRPPELPLRPADAAWAADLLKKHARKRK